MQLKELTGFPGYLISKDGTIYSDKRKTRKPLSPRNLNGYDTVVLTVEKKQYVRYIHKLVAQEFLRNDNPKDKTQVIHKDGDKRNNDVSNLKWVKKGEGARQYFKTNDVRRNKFNEGDELPGTVFEGSSIYEDSKTKGNDSLSDQDLTAKINGFSKEILAEKRRYKRKIQLLDQDQKKQIEQLKKDQTDPERLEKQINKLIQHYHETKSELEKDLTKRIYQLEAQKADALRLRKQRNKYFYYKGAYHKVNDTGKSLVIRVKDKDGNWRMLSVAKIIMEEKLGKIRPTPKHKIGFKDFDYRNITPINMIWETPKEKSIRYMKMFPFKYPSIGSENQQKEPSNKPEDFHDEILRLRAEGKNFNQIAQILKVPYYKLYHYCKKKNI